MPSLPRKSTCRPKIWLLDAGSVGGEQPDWGRVARSQPKQETRDDSKSGGEAQFVRKKFIFVKARSNHPLPLTPAGVKVSLSHLGSVCQDSRGNFRGKASANEEWACWKQGEGSSSSSLTSGCLANLGVGGSWSSWIRLPATAFWAWSLDGQLTGSNASRTGPRTLRAERWNDGPAVTVTGQRRASRTTKQRESRAEISDWRSKTWQGFILGVDLIVGRRV